MLLENLTEPIVIQDIFVSGLAEVEDLEDGNQRFTFYARQKSAYGGSENVMVARLVLSTGAVHTALRMTMKAMGFRCCGAQRNMAGCH